jgi:hypothetical protein
MSGTGLYFGEASTKVGSLESIIFRRATLASTGRVENFDGTLAGLNKARQALVRFRDPKLVAMLSKKMTTTFVQQALNQDGDDKYRDFPEKIRRVDQVEELLKGNRPDGGKTPSVFTMSRRFNQVLSRYRKPHGIPKSDMALIQARERYLDMTGSLRLNPGGLAQMRGLPRLSKPYRELDPEGKVAFLYEAGMETSLPFDNG